MAIDLIVQHVHSQLEEVSPGSVLLLLTPPSCPLECPQPAPFACSHSPGPSPLGVGTGAQDPSTTCTQMEVVLAWKGSCPSPPCRDGKGVPLSCWPEATGFHC